jgi:hypothetical protein
MHSLSAKFNTLPESIKNEVLDYIEFLVKKNKKYKEDKKPKFGSSKGFYKMSDNFDDPMEDFKEYTL